MNIDNEKDNIEILHINEVKKLLIEENKPLKKSTSNGFANEFYKLNDEKMKNVKTRMRKLLGNENMFIKLEIEFPVQMRIGKTNYILIYLRLNLSDKDKLKSSTLEDLREYFRINFEILRYDLKNISGPVPSSCFLNLFRHYPKSIRTHFLIFNFK